MKIYNGIDQLDGSQSSSEESDNFAQSYWQQNYMGTIYQTYLDVIKNTKPADITGEDNSSSETERAIKAREDEFLKDGLTLDFIHKRWPLWSSGGGYW